MAKLSLSNLTSISPVDGRYGDKTAFLRPLLSEYGLIHHRVQVELTWLTTLLKARIFPDVPALTQTIEQSLEAIPRQFDLTQAQEIKHIEARTNHDVKAVEYFLAEHFRQNPELTKLIPLLHFACTSEDINNLAWALILKQTRNTILLPAYQCSLDKLVALAESYADIPMLARTHGQAATPTTLGKELANPAARLHTQMTILKNIKITGKFNGAVGNFNAHTIAFPDVDWPALSQQMLASLHISNLPYTTQIEPHDYIAELLHASNRINTVLIDLCRDLWAYVSLGYFCQRAVETEIGSSTMPHKINPIDFENAEGNFGIANGLAKHLAEKLPISRWQRDLSDSTVLRSLGTVFAHNIIALDALNKGLDKLNVSEKTIADDLNEHWEVLGEAVQIMLRKYGCTDAYEQLKALTRGKTNIDAVSMRNFIQTLDLPQTEKDKLLTLSPRDYTGLAQKLAKDIGNYLHKRPPSTPDDQ